MFKAVLGTIVLFQVWFLGYVRILVLFFYIICFRSYNQGCSRGYMQIYTIYLPPVISVGVYSPHLL